MKIAMIDLTRLAQNMARTRMDDVRNIRNICSAEEAGDVGFEAHVGVGR